jgi:hypothetical protein
MTAFAVPPLGGVATGATGASDDDSGGAGTAAGRGAERGALEAEVADTSARAVGIRVVRPTRPAAAIAIARAKVARAGTSSRDRVGAAAVMVAVAPSNRITAGSGAPRGVARPDSIRSTMVSRARSDELANISTHSPTFTALASGRASSIAIAIARALP